MKMRRIASADVKTELIGLWRTENVLYLLMRLELTFLTPMVEFGAGKETARR